jgi:hypothetical protein
MKTVVLSVVLVGFGVLSGLALFNHGYWGIIEPHFKSFGAAQVLADLVIALTLVLTWLVRDAKKTGRNPFGWILLTLATGSFGPLIYLLTAKERAAA